MKRLIVAVALLVDHRAHAQAVDTFETAAQTAQPLRRVESLVWALTSACDAGDDVQQRQCRRVRDGRQRELSTGTWLVVADSDAFDVGTWSATKKSLPISLAACIRCAGVELEGKTWYVIARAASAAATPPRFEAGKLRPGMLHDNARTFADEATASMWGSAVAKVVVEMVVRLAAKPRWSEAGKNGIALEVVAYRVFTPCDGTVILASPPSSPVEPDNKTCAAQPAPTVAEAEAGPQVEQLTAAMIDAAMQPVVDAAWKCYGMYAVTGKAKLKLTITTEGGIGKYEQQGDFASTPMGACIDKAMAKSHFPRSNKTKSTIIFPITIQP